MSRELTSIAVMAKEAREALKNAFPGVKFSVKSSNYSMGHSYSVSWIDGPTVEEVEQYTTCKHSKIHYCEASGEILSGGNTFVSSHRSISLDILKEITKEIVTSYKDWEYLDFDAIDFKLNKDGSAYLCGNYYIKTNGYYEYLDSYISKEFRNRSYYKKPGKSETTGKSKTNQEAKTTTGQGVTVKLNNDKNGVEVYFDSAPTSEQVSKLTGHGFKQSYYKTFWYAKQTTETLEVAYSFTARTEEQIVKEGMDRIMVELAITAPPVQKKTNLLYFPMPDTDQRNEALELLEEEKSMLREIHRELIDTCIMKGETILINPYAEQIENVKDFLSAEDLRKELIKQRDQINMDQDDTDVIEVHTVSIKPVTPSWIVISEPPQMITKTITDPRDALKEKLQGLSIDNLPPDKLQALMQLLA